MRGESGVTISDAYELLSFSSREPHVGLVLILWHWLHARKLSLTPVLSLASKQKSFMAQMQ